MPLPAMPGALLLYKRARRVLSFQILRTWADHWKILQWINAACLGLESALGQDTDIPNLELQLVGKYMSQPNPLTSPIPFLFQYDYLGDRRPVPAGLFPYNYPPSPTVHDKMVRSLSHSSPPQGLSRDALCPMPGPSGFWQPLDTSSLPARTLTPTQGASQPFSSVTQARGVGPRSGSMSCPSPLDFRTTLPGGTWRGLEKGLRL